MLSHLKFHTKIALSFKDITFHTSYTTDHIHHGNQKQEAILDWSSSIIQALQNTFEIRIPTKEIKRGQNSNLGLLCLRKTLAYLALNLYMNM